MEQNQQSPINKFERKKTHKDINKGKEMNTCKLSGIQKRIKQAAPLEMEYKICKINE